MKKSRAIGISLLWVLLFLGIQVIISMAVTIGSTFANGLNSIEQIVSGTVPLTLVLCNTATVIIVLIAAGLSGNGFSSVLGIKKPTAAGIIVPAVFAAALVPLVSLVLESITIPDSVSGTYDQLMDMAVTNDALSVISVTLLAPVCEELIFRGAVLHTLKKAFPTAFSVLFTAFLFGLVHFNLIQSSYAFILGIILCLVCLRFDSLWASIAAHVIFNVLGGYLDLSRFSPAVQTAVPIAGGIAALLLGAWMILSYISRKKAENDPGDTI